MYKYAHTYLFPRSDMRRALCGHGSGFAAWMFPALLFVLGCSPAAPTAVRALTATRTVVGDTTIVLTAGTPDSTGFHTLVPEFSFGRLSGPEALTFGSPGYVRIAPNGNIWIYDRRPSALRLFDSTGNFIRNVGREGDGPGEYRRAYGLALLPNGVGALWELSRSRVNFYSPAGEPLRYVDIPDPGGFEIEFASDALTWDTAGFVYVRMWVGGVRRSRTTGLLQLHTDGTIGDSLLPPTFGLEEVSLTARWPGGFSTYDIPHYPDQIWTWSPHGYFVGGRGDRYAIHLLHRNGKVTRIEREVPQVAVNEAQRADAVDGAVRTMRARDPTWEWTGPEVPRLKPYFTDISVDDNGRIWVRIPGETEVIPDAERPTRAPPGGGAPVPYGSRFRETFHFEVFAPTGELLGSVRPGTTGRWVAKRGNHVWSVTQTPDDVPAITRFRIDPPLVAGERR
jgi:hypothetical protein